MYSTNSGDKNLTIGKGSRVRVKLIGTRVDATEIFAIGSIKDDYLGLIDGDKTSGYNSE